MAFNVSTFKKTFSLFAPHVIKNNRSKMLCLLAALLILVDVAVSSLVPYYSKQVVNTLSANIATSIGFITLLLGFFWTLEKTLSHIQDIIFFPVINNTIRAMTANVVQHIHQVPYPEYQKLSIPEIINCIRRISMSARAFIKILCLMIIPTTIKLIITSVVIIKLGAFGFGLLLSFAIALYILYQGTKWYTNMREIAWKTSDKVIMRINDSLLNTHITRLFPNCESMQIDQILHQEANLWYKTNTRLHSIHIVIGLVLGLAITMILYCAIQAIQHKSLTIGDFVLLQGQLIAAFLPLKVLSVEFRQLAESLIDIKRIAQVLDIPKQKQLATDGLLSMPKNFQPIIFLDKISFEHEENLPLFQNFSLQIKEGEKVALIGESGSGKSSLLGLITSLLSPKQGTVYIQGFDVATLPKHQLGTILHYIPQNFHLFNMDLRYNLTYGTNNVSEEELCKIIQAIGLSELISNMKEGLNTLVGEMGTRLSGGEQQRVALARALLLKPEILILDETTHSLNEEDEERILKLLFSRIKTVIIVSHRASTLNHVDKIFQIKEGKLFNIDIPKDSRKMKSRVQTPETEIC